MRLNRVDFEWVLGALPYGRLWRHTRGAFHRGMSASAIYPYRHIQHEEVKRHLLRLLENPEDFTESGRKYVRCPTCSHFDSHSFTVFRMIGAIIIRVVYGLDVYGPDEKYVRIAEKSMECFSALFDPGRYLVHTLPWLRFVPAWFPGAGFQREFAAWKPQVTAARDLPWEAAAEKKVSCIRLSVAELQSEKRHGVVFSEEAARTYSCCFFFQHANRAHRKRSRRRDDREMCCSRSISW